MMKDSFVNNSFTLIKLDMLTEVDIINKSTHNK